MSAATFVRNRSSRTRPARRVPCAFDVEQRRRRVASSSRASARTSSRIASSARASPRSAASGGRLSPLELPLEEIERKRGVGFVERVDAVQRQQVLRARDRILQRAIRLVDPRRRLQREPLLRVAGGGVAIGMHFALQRAGRRGRATPDRSGNAPAGRTARNGCARNRSSPSRASGSRRRHQMPRDALRVSLDVEGLAAAARVLDVGIVELESFVQPLAREVELGPVEVRQALRDRRGPSRRDSRTRDPRAGRRRRTRACRRDPSSRTCARRGAARRPCRACRGGSRRASPRIRSM